MCTWGYKLMDVPYFNLAYIIVYPYTKCHKKWRDYRIIKTFEFAFWNDKTSYLIYKVYLAKYASICYQVNYQLTGRRNKTTLHLLPLKLSFRTHSPSVQQSEHVLTI